jgi:hypothetical protein
MTTFSATQGKKRSRFPTGTITDWRFLGSQASEFLITPWLFHGLVNTSRLVALQRESADLQPTLRRWRNTELDLHVPLTAHGCSRKSAAALQHF